MAERSNTGSEPTSDEGRDALQPGCPTSGGDDRPKVLVVGQAGEAIPFGLELAGAILILLLSVKPVGRFIRSRFAKVSPVNAPAPSDSGNGDLPEPCVGGT